MIPDITLYPPNILVTAQLSTIGLEILNGNYMFGVVVDAYATEEDLIGKNINFASNDIKMQFKYGSTLYYVIAKDKIQFTEPTLIP